VHPRARGQRRRRAVHPHVEGAAAVGADVRPRRRAAPGAPRVQGPLPPRMALRAPRASDAGRGPGAEPPDSRMSRPRLAVEPHNGSRIRDLDGGAISLSPPRPFRRSYHQLGVHTIGGGTRTLSRKASVFQPSCCWYLWMLASSNTLTRNSMSSCLAGRRVILTDGTCRLTLWSRRSRPPTPVDGEFRADRRRNSAEVRESQVNLPGCEHYVFELPGHEPEASEEGGNHGIVVPVTRHDHLDLGLESEAADDLDEGRPPVALALMRAVDHEPKDRADATVDLVHDEADHRDAGMLVSARCPILDGQRYQARIG